MRIKQALSTAIETLTSARVPSPRLNAEILLMFVLGCDRAYLHAHSDRELSAEESTRYDDALAQRSRGMPSQYITGHQEFWGMDFVVTPAVLVPRPETEHVIETILPLARTKSMAKLKIVDVGTGSGCIAVALAKELSHAEIYATDISSAALEIARINATRHQLENCIRFGEADLLAGFPSSSFDFVVSNPPYVGESEEDHVQLEVRKFEPRNAVFAGPKGTEVIARLIPQAWQVLRPGGWLVMEISGTIYKEVGELLSDWKEVKFVNDLQGIRRVALAKRY